MSDKVVAHFAALQGLNQNIINTASGVGDVMQNWMKTAGITQQAWLDSAGGAFGEVSQAANQVSNATNDMLNALGGGVTKTNNGMQETLMAAQNRFMH